MPLPTLGAELGDKVQISDWPTHNDAPGSLAIATGRTRIDDDRKVDMTVVWHCNPTAALTADKVYKATDPHDIVIGVIGNVPLRPELDVPNSTVAQVDKFLTDLVHGNSGVASAQVRFLPVVEWFDAQDHGSHGARAIDDFKFVIQHGADDFRNHSVWNIQFPIGGVDQVVSISLTAPVVREFLSGCDATATNLTAAAERKRITEGQSAVAEGEAAFRRQDYGASLRAYLKAVDLGFSSAAIDVALGWMYDTGQGAERNFAQAWEWFQAAAKRGDAEAQYRLGRMAESGQDYWGGQPNYRDAEKWYLAAAAQDHVGAQGALAMLYAYAPELQNDAKSLRYARGAAEKGDDQGEFIVATDAIYNASGVPPNCDIGLPGYEGLAAHGMPEAEYGLAMLYHDGTCVPQNMDTYKKWMEAALKSPFDARRAGQVLQQKRVGSPVTQHN